jgi:hypothetical protein
MITPEVLGENVTLSEVSEYLGDSAPLVDNCITSSGLDIMCREQAKIGLILRYRCVGGFDSNLHGSVPANWNNELTGFVECFASPLNHKFDRFHSMFDEDCVFGGRGDFFKLLSDNGRIFPPGDYEINPPFHVELINQVAEAVKLSFEVSKIDKTSLRVVCIVPDWSGAEFIDILNSVVVSLGMNHANVHRKRYEYCHSNGQPLKVWTKFYVLSSHRVKSRDRLQFQTKCSNLIELKK